MFLGSRARPTSPPSVSRLSRQRGILNILQPYKNSRPLTGIVWPFYMSKIFVLHRKHTMGLSGLLRGYLCFFICRWSPYLAENVCGPQRSLYRDSFTVLYVDDVRTSQETLLAFTACYGDSFTLLYVYYVRTSQETPTGLHDLWREYL
jgi:hypothetical protein